MKRSNVFLYSLSHIIIAFIILFLMELFLKFFLEFIYFKALIPFNELSLIIKLIILIFGGFIIISILSLLQRIITMIGGLIFERLKKTEFSEVIVDFASIVNIIYIIIWFFRIPPSYNFWIITELIFISLFIWQFQRIVLPSKLQKELNKKEESF